ncbi:MAG: hypothetical protein COW65_03345 [Cytophagales bacterium CG18_big_fil_WC_8_21_14_2_50_42_9]|nr:MAG: hypothetical protein COW65_03345 [Cytophagales bacterium CG18_big_fil_WC_8_21_14_2_50_42_9]
MSYKILWTDEAIRNLEQILNYIETNWTDKEVNKFKIKLSEQLNIISKFPNIFPSSTIAPRLRKAVLTRQTIIFYEVKEQVIYIAYIFDSRRSPERIK